MLCEVDYRGGCYRGVAGAYKGSCVILGWAVFIGRVGSGAVGGEGGLDRSISEGEGL